MKKKIKDLTIEQLFNICLKHIKKCKKCPVYNVNVCGCLPIDMNEQELEIEVDEND